MSYFEKISSLSLVENPIIMGIETSCDETAVAIIKNGRENHYKRVKRHIPSIEEKQAKYK